jgi:hypothetical protein
MGILGTVSDGKVFRWSMCGSDPAFVSDTEDKMFRILKWLV